MSGSSKKKIIPRDSAGSRLHSDSGGSQSKMIGSEELRRQCEEDRRKKEEETGSEEERRQWEEELLSRQKTRKSIERTAPGGSGLGKKGQSPAEEKGEGRVRVRVEAGSDLGRREESSDSRRGGETTDSSYGLDRGQMKRDVDGMLESSTMDIFRRTMMYVRQVREDTVAVLKRSKVRKDAVDDFKESMDTIQELISRVEEKRVEAVGRLKERKEIFEEIRNMQRSKEEGGAGLGTYAERVREGRKEGDAGESCEKRKVKVEFVVTKEGKDAEEIRREIVREDPRKMNVKVEKMIRTKRGLVIAVEGQEEVEKLRASEMWKDKGLVIWENRKKNPMVMIFDLPGGRDEEEVLMEMYDRNMVGVGMGEDEFLKRVRVRRKTRHRVGGRVDSGGKENWIMEVDGVVFKVLMRQEKIYMGWEACKVKEYADVVRCYHCQGFGHIARNCRVREQVCGKCARGHKTEDCKVKGEEQLCCVNCKNEGREAKHPAGWSGCGIYKRNVEKYYLQVEYEV